MQEEAEELSFPLQQSAKSSAFRCNNRRRAAMSYSKDIALDISAAEKVDFFLTTSMVDMTLTL